ncbi:MAG: ABC transporter ATP-binding protein [Chitinivibrionales bacterium]|nr:ABC transporter ATP-binding protein [Chitinivibrionales bacterium]
MVEVQQLEKTFKNDAGPIPVLRKTSFSIAAGEMVALVGASGAGKTTLLQILGGLDSYDNGSVRISGRELSSMNHKELAVFRGLSMGFVFQFHYLLPDFTALENVMMPGIIQNLVKKQCKGRAEELLERMGLQQRLTHFPSELSGGERQRVALARALFNKPLLVLADEPTGNLDSSNSRQLLELFKETNQELKQTYLIATHNEHLAESLSKTLFMEDGQISVV